MIRALALCILLLVASVAYAGELDATWTAPTTNTDGSALTDLGSYRLYWFLFPNTPCPGTQFLVVPSPTTTPAPGTQPTARLTGLTQGLTYNVQVTAVDTGGSESACSVMASGVARADTAPPPPPPPPSSALAFALDEGTGTTVADRSGALLGTVTAGTWTTGKYGNALQFAGTGYVSIPPALALDLGSTGTISAFVRLDQLGRWHGIIAKGGVNSTDAHNYGMEVSNSNRLECGIGNGATSVVAAPTQTIPQGQVVHLACTWDGTTVTAYIDAVARASTTQTLTPTSNTAPLWIGQYGGNADRTIGMIDEVRVYARALTPVEVQSDMLTPLGGRRPTPGTPGEIRFIP